MISIVDYGVCNLSSIFNMLKQIGVKSKIINTPDEVVKSEFIILPGVGNFENGVQNLRNRSLDLALKEANQNKVNILGICLGMHLMFERSEEGNKSGLGLLKGKVKKFNAGAVLSDNFMQDDFNNLLEVTFKTNRLASIKNNISSLHENNYFFSRSSFIADYIEENY